MEERNLLDDIFSPTEEQIETFLDVLGDTTDAQRVIAGTPEKVAAPELVDQTSGWIRIQHGWHADDYVLHMANARPTKPFRVSTERVVYAIAQTMNLFIPDTVVVNIYLPKPDWDVPEITFKCIDLKAAWSVNEAVITKMVLKLFLVLNQLV
jgi:hypothetical protein